VVEQLAVNQLVVGSNPTGGAILFEHFQQKHDFPFDAQQRNHSSVEV
jgi:hypothetical protein